MRKLLSCSGIFLCFSGSALAQQASGGAPGEWSLHAAFGAVVVGLIVANAYVVSLFHAKPPGESSGVLARLAEKWEFSPQGLGGFSWRQLALWSLLALFFELLMIRWISSEIRVFAYFKNFVLIACFLGFGLGCYMSRRRVNLLTMVIPLLTLALVVTFRWSAGGAFIICLALLTLGTGKQGKVYWSPYQKLTLAPRAAEGKIFEYELTTNDIFYQQILDLSPEFVAAHPSLFAAVPAQWNAYNLPYHFYSHPPSVLVLGSGMGNDVAAALRNGAGQVTAVEIDPLILKLGEKYHFEKPYSSPRVRQVQDDARSYVQNSRDRFDLIVFSLLDSHTTSSHYTNIRIDNYVYTLEALQASKRLLCWVLLRDTGTTLRSLQWHFFFLGAGFMLLEAQIVSKMALLFGTTWLVNSVVIAGLLLLIVGANLLVQFFPRIPVSIGYAGIFLTLLASYLIPLEKFFYPSLWAKPLSSTLVLCMPVLFAGIVFIRSFAEQGFRADSLGSNVMGAMIGGMLESMSLWTGIRSLLVIAALLYVASWVALALEHSFGPGVTKADSDFTGEILVGASQGT